MITGFMTLESSRASFVQSRLKGASTEGRTRLMTSIATAAAANQPA